MNNIIDALFIIVLLLLITKKARGQVRRQGNGLLEVVLAPNNVFF